MQPWPSVSLRVALSPDWYLNADATGRIAGDERTSQLVNRLQIGRVLTPRLSFSIGYTHYENYVPHAPDGHEEQAVEQLDWQAGRIGPVRLTSRTRLEQRFVHGVSETGWRLREQLRATVPLGRSRFSLVAFGEPFVALNHTASMPRTLDQLRGFAGLSYRMSKHADLTMGYLNQFLTRQGPGIDNDAVPLVLNLTF